ncbi:heat shock protein transcriptional repressor HspR [Bifidobacterium choloepi]|uniref:Helix-turn-helix transcriptional regulator n=1 Tax=Bifidobacterium choloepi TaxID=2614131 RepID=A0A6I5N2Y6_9BIFI|nr:helix-turn-helix transcriptional regulator [Bifidobacterium choloepi]NEG70545.1 helix-turn-helix transcriptional regulator [Bifidobacterium choloepi]
MARMAQQMKKLYEMCAMAIVSGRGDLDGAAGAGFDVELPIFTVGRAAELAGVHPQTLRQYDRLGIVVPQRTGGGARRYSLRDIDRLAQAQRLSQDEGINLSGITRILRLEEENRELRRQNDRLRKPSGASVFTADAGGDIVEVRRSQHMRQWRHQIRVNRRALPAGSSHEQTPPADAASRAVVLWRDTRDGVEGGGLDRMDR